MTTKQAYRSMLKDVPDVLNAKQLALVLGVCSKTAYTMLKNGDIKYLKVGRRILVPKLNVIEYLNNNGL